MPKHFKGRRFHSGAVYSDTPGRQRSVELPQPAEKSRMTDPDLDPELIRDPDLPRQKKVKT